MASDSDGSAAVQTEARTDGTSYRRQRRHVYPLAPYREALRTGGLVTSYCGVTVRLSTGDPARVTARKHVERNDCATCVDIWQRRTVVRL